MYKQTDERVSIYARTKDNKTGITQTYNVMKKWGCLFASLLYLVEQISNRLFSPSQIKLLYRLLVCEKYLEKDMFVNNHVKVLKTGLEILGYDKYHVEYVAKQDYIKPENSWGSAFQANYQLLEIETENNNHHFKHHNFDPYEPPTETKRKWSKRFYLITVEQNGFL